VSPKYSVESAADYQSQVLGGRFVMSTPDPLVGLLDLYPLQGMEQFQSGVSALRYQARNALDNDGLDAAIDTSGSGTFSLLGATAWNSSVKGFLWWEPRSGTAAPNPSGFGIGTKNDFTMHLMLADPTTNVADNASINLFFSGPVASNNFFTFEGQGGATDVVANATINGGIVVATPNTPLQHGGSYRLKTADGFVHSEFTGVNEDAFYVGLTVAP
jgi:hypothetical protein